MVFQAGVDLRTTVHLDTKRKKLREWTKRMELVTKCLCRDRKPRGQKNPSFCHVTNPPSTIQFSNHHLRKADLHYIGSASEYGYQLSAVVVALDYLLKGDPPNFLKPDHPS